MSRNDCPRDHEFVLVLAGVEDLTEGVMDALFEAGCDDATPSMRFGRVYLTFSRESRSFREAVLSAIRDVRSANIGATVLCVDDCNLVSQAEIGRRIGRTRQMIGQYVSGKRGPGNFPGPVCEITEGHPLWAWCEVSYWLNQNGIVGDEVLDDSRLIAAVNNVLETIHLRQLDPSLMEEVLQLAGESSPATAE